MLFQRKNSKRWQDRIKRNTDEWVVYSTKKADIEQAILIRKQLNRLMNTQISVLLQYQNKCANGFMKIMGSGF